MTMHLNLSPEMEAYVRGKVASGFYGNATEVIRDAIRRMQEEDIRGERSRAAIPRVRRISMQDGLSPTRLN